MARNTFFITDAVADGIWSEYQFGSSMNGIHIINRGAADIEFSFNGEDIDGLLLATDLAQTRDEIDETRIYIRGVGGAANIQVETWRGER